MPRTDHELAIAAVRAWSLARIKTPELKQPMYGLVLQMIANAEGGPVSICLPGNVRITREPKVNK